jgi:hypothetical protein
MGGGKIVADGKPEDALALLERPLSPVFIRGA